MLTRDQFIQYLERLLQPQSFSDYCPNGLQVAGSEPIRHVVTGVTASQALIQAAIDRGADTLLVHHGYFWKGEDPRLVGIKRERIKSLLLHDINLIAYHLPLDAHPVLGNNAQLARLLELRVAGPINTEPNQLTLKGRLPYAMTAGEFSGWIEQRLGRVPLHIGDPQQRIETIAWCTGAAQNYLQLAVDAGVDAFLTGEISEPCVHLARETGVHFYGAGHHATERYGVKALGEHLADKLDIKVEFVEIDNPV